MKFLLLLAICLIFIQPVNAEEPIGKARFYHYEIEITAVYDGDTVTADIHVGFGITLVGQKLRLYGINTPEVRGPEKPDGIITRDEVRAKILGQTLIMDSHGDSKGKFGRWLATLWLEEEDGSWTNINDWIINSGLGKPAIY